jgi:diguanylate cyclase (GGDEF)-like protein/PAS domain S-box-containing protein
LPSSDPTDKERRGLIEIVFDSLEHDILVLDRDFNILVANRRVEERFASQGPLVGKKCYTVTRDRIRPCPECPYVRSLATGQPHTQIVRACRHDDPDGKPGWFEISSNLIRDSGGAVIGAIEQVKDVTDVKRIEEDLTDEVSRRRLLVEQSKDGIVVLDHSGRVHEANQQFARMLGYSTEEVYQLHVWDWDAVWDKASLLEQIAEADEHGSHFEARHRRKDGTLLEVELSTNGVYYRGEKLVFCVCRDITEKKALQEKIRQLAIRDPLTEIFNRRYIFQRLAEVAAEYERGEAEFCISIMDLDHFKGINDTYGHRVGDLTLKAFANLVGSLIRPYDIFGRYGGEEFVVVSRNAAEAEVAAMLTRIRAKVRTTAFTFWDHEIRLTFSCGLASSTEYAREAFSLEHMVSLADQRLYEAKAAGRDRCVSPCNPDSAVGQTTSAQVAPSTSPSS